jgi:hypothetical protein
VNLADATGTAIFPGESSGLRLTHPIKQGRKDVPWALHFFLQSSTESSRSVMIEKEFNKLISSLCKLFCDLLKKLFLMDFLRILFVKT